MKTVYIIAAQDVTTDMTDERTVLRECRIQNKLPVIVEHALRMLNGNVVAGQLVCGLCLRTVGINPCVQFHASLVAFVNHPFQGVPVRLRCPTLLCRQETAPRLNVALIERIAFRTHLKENGIHPVLEQLI